jgi:HK97 family phage major capsid protein
LRSYTPTDAQKETRTQRPGREQRDLTTSTGGYFVPQEFYPVLTQAEKAWGSILPELNTKKTDNGAPMKIAFSNDTGNLLMLDSEPSSMSEVEPGLSSLLLSTDALKTNIIKVTLAELQDSAFDLDAFIRDIFGKRYYRGLTSLVTNGTFAGSPSVAQNIESLLTAAYDAVTTLDTTKPIQWADLVAIYGALDPAYGIDAIWSFNSKTRATLLGVTDTLGRPLYIPAPTVGTFDTLLGKRVVLNQYMENAASGTSSNSGAVSVLYGDFKQGYLLREVKPGLAIVRLNERFMDTLEVGFLGYCRAGGISTDAGTHPIIALTQK